MSEEEFIATADDFDVLLFKTDDPKANLVRIGTWSEYGKSINFSHQIIDHAAIVVTKNMRPGTVWFLEANAEGVMFKNWRHISRLVGKWYSKLVIRRLKFNKTREQRARLYEFSETVNGNDYQLNIPGVMLGTKVST